MAPKTKGSAKIKDDVEENGKSKRARVSRNVKATSYKDPSDSDDDKKRKQDSGSESEEEKPKRKTVGRKKAPPKRKSVSVSEEDDSDFRSSDEDARPSRKSKPTRNLRAARNASYKDLSDSEEDILDESESEEEKPKKKKPAPKKAARVEEEEDEEEELEEDEEDDVDEEEEENDVSDIEDEKKEVSAPTKAKKETSGSGDEAPSKSLKSVKTPEKEPSSPKVENKSEDENLSESEPEEKSKDGSTGADKKSSSKVDHELSDENLSEEEKVPKKRGRPAKSGADVKEEKEQPPAKKAKTEDKPKLNKTDSDFSTMDFSCEKKTKDGKPWNFKISSWNVAGLKAWVKKNGLDFIKHEQPDILCLQETKCSEKKLPPECKVKGYHTYWLSGEKEGYAGVAVLSKEKPIKVDYGVGEEDFDTEGRVITAEYEKFFLVNVYVPNAGQGLKNLSRRMEWDPLFRAYIKSLDEKKPVILCGDLNVSHLEIDLANPKTNTKSAGFTPEEREGMTTLLKEGFVDTFRHLYPDKTGAYSYWTYLSNARSRNTGWRLDYFIFSERLMPALCDNVMRSEVYGSDHCPITLFAHI